MKHRTHPVSIVLLLFVFIWPILMAFLLTLVGQLMGCELVSNTKQCLVMGLNLGEAINGLLAATWQFPLLAWFPFLWILAALGLIILILHELRGWPRLMVGLLSIWFLPLAPSWLGSLYVERLAPIGKCALQGASPCWLFGVNMESAFATAALIPWLTFIILPVSAILSLTYLVILWLIRPRRRRLV